MNGCAADYKVTCMASCGVGLEDLETVRWKLALANFGKSSFVKRKGPRRMTWEL